MKLKAGQVWHLKDCYQTHKATVVKVTGEIVKYFPTIEDNTYKLTGSYVEMSLTQFLENYRPKTKLHRILRES